MAHDRIPVRLVAMRHLAEGTLSLELQRLDHACFAMIEPGAHVDLVMPNDMTRSYSILTTGENLSRLTVAVKREVSGRGGSAYIHDVLRVGQMLHVSEPRNLFRLDGASHSVLIAGGIGMTPILSMARHLTMQGKPFELHYACHDRRTAAFLDEAAALSGARVYISEDQSDRLDLARIVAEAPPAAHFYCCGPARMITAFQEATSHRDPDFIHVEHFAAAAPIVADGDFQIELARSGRRLAVHPGHTILEVLRDAGLDVPFSCEQGVCGSCETKVVSGVPDHRDSILTEKERAAGRSMMVCCSGSKSDLLVLDL